jgi:hypothetical protein
MSFTIRIDRTNGSSGAPKKYNILFAGFHFAARTAANTLDENQYSSRLGRSQE